MEVAKVNLIHTRETEVEVTTVKGRCNDTAVESLPTSLDSVQYKRKKKDYDRDIGTDPGIPKEELERAANP